MTASFEIDARWIARDEGTSACAVRLARMLIALAALHPAFGHWYKKGYSRASANRRFCAMPPQTDELTQIFEKGRQYKDVSKELMPELGYSVSAWNGVDRTYGVSLSLSVGGYGQRRNFPNSVQLNLPHMEPDNADLNSVKCVKAILLTIIDAWEPSWARATDWSYTGKFYASEPTPTPTGGLNYSSSKPSPAITGGWMTYLSAPYARRIIPARSAITEPVAGGGILMLATNEVFDVGNSQHVAAADAIQASLEPLQSNPKLL